MKLTKVLREYVEEQMNKARYKANKEARAEYDARKADAEAEIKEFLAEVVNPRIQAILEANGMDLTVSRWSSNQPAVEEVLSFNSTYIINAVEADAIRKAETERAKKQEQAIKEFAIECELGIDKESFYKAVAALVANVQ